MWRSTLLASPRLAACRRTLPPRTTSAAAPTTRRGLAGGGGHVPVPQSAQAQLWQGHPTKEGWESTVIWWYTSSFVLLVGILGFAPETEIQTWAKQEAQARLKLQDKNQLVFGTHYSNLEEESRDTKWDKFSTKSIRMSEDDDDDDDEEEEVTDDADE